MQLLVKKCQFSVSNYFYDNKESIPNLYAKKGIIVSIPKYGDADEYDTAIKHDQETKV